MGKLVHCLTLFPQRQETNSGIARSISSDPIQLPDMRIKVLSANLCAFVCTREQDAREMAVLVAALLLIGSAFLGTSRGEAESIISAW